MKTKNSLFVVVSNEEPLLVIEKIKKCNQHSKEYYYSCKKRIRLAKKSVGQN